MADENKTEEKPQITREFIGKGAEKTVTLSHKEEKMPDKKIFVQFGHFVTKKEGEEDKIAGRFKVTIPTVTDGMEVDHEAMATKADKAIAQAIKNWGVGTAEDFVFDLDDEYFEQKVSAEKVDATNVWKSDKFKEARKELANLRGEAEGHLEALAASKENAQAEQVAFSNILAHMLELCGDSIKALESAVRGPGGSDNHPLMAKLGKGTNAVREALRFSQLSDAQFAVLPSSLTSGKGLDTHKSRALTKITTDITNVSTGERAMTWPEDITTKTGTRLPDVTSLGNLLRQFTKKAFGIENAEAVDVDLSDLVTEVNDAASTMAAEFDLTYGKDVNTYDSDEYNAALMIYGRVTVSDGGEDLFAKAVNVLYELSDETDADKQRKGIVDLYNNNLLVKRCVDTAWKQKATVDTEKRNREVLKELDGNEVIGKQASKKLSELSAQEAAAHYFQSIARHPLRASLWAELKRMANAANWADDKQEEKQQEPAE